MRVSSARRRRSAVRLPYRRMLATRKSSSSSVASSGPGARRSIRALVRPSKKDLGAILDPETERTTTRSPNLLSRRSSTARIFPSGSAQSKTCVPTASISSLGTTVSIATAASGSTRPTTFAMYGPRSEATVEANKTTVTRTAKETQQPVQLRQREHHASVEGRRRA